MISHICCLKCNSLNPWTFTLFKGFHTTQFVFKQTAITVGLTLFFTALQKARGHIH